MKRVLLGTLAVLGLALAGLANSAAAEPLAGSLRADALYVRGEVAVQSDDVVAAVDGSESGFASEPSLEFWGADVTILQRSERYVATAGGQPVEDPTHRRPGISVVSDVTLAIDQWLDADAAVVARHLGGAGTGGTQSTLVDSLSPIGIVREANGFRFGAHDEFASNILNSYSVPIDAGSAEFSGTDFGDSYSFEGTFELYLYGAAVTLTHSEGQEKLQSGHRVSQDTQTLGLTETHWVNLTVLQVNGGQVVIHSEGNPSAMYADTGILQGTGLVLLRNADGVVERTDDQRFVAGQDLAFEGAFDLSFDGNGETGRFMTGVTGEFDIDALGLAFTGTIPGDSGSSFLWWAVLLVGVTVASGSGVLVARQRRWRRLRVRSAQPQAVEEKAEVVTRPGDGELLDAGDALHMQPGFTWDDLTEEFGVVRAAEKSGVVVVLVPSDRVENFLRAVVSRGLIAEDTGDRVHAGAHELAVVALEPSPVMMN